jgi:DNA-binding transcriptional ArsR family regulator
MPQAGFTYLPANDVSAIALAVSVFADRAHVRDQIGEDAAAAGFVLRECGEVAALLAGEPRPLGEVVLLDCPTVDAGMLAALARLDMRAVRSGAHLVISTTVEALDDVFACCDQSDPQILVDPTRAERVIALGRVLAKVPNLRLRELTEDDRLTLLRLTEQVDQIAQRLERLGGGQSAVLGSGLIQGDGAFRFESPAPAYSGPENGAEDDGRGNRPVRTVRPPMPDSRLVRRIIRQRQLRARFFEGELFADPAWDILLDLTAARVEHARVSVTSLCIASGVPPTTALRWIGQLTEAGLLERVEDETDRRRVFISLTDKATDAMARYFAQLGRSAAQIV